MGANTRIFVQVVKEHVEWIEVSAISLDEALIVARQENPDVVRVISAQHEDPREEE